MNSPWLRELIYWSNTLVFAGAWIGLKFLDENQNRGGLIGQNYSDSLWLIYISGFVLTGAFNLVSFKFRSLKWGVFVTSVLLSLLLGFLTFQYKSFRIINLVLVSILTCLNFLFLELQD